MTAIIHSEGCTLFVKGDVDFNNVALLYKQSLVIFKSKSINKINLAALTSSNSAMLVLLIEWLKRAKSVEQTLQIEALPSQLAQIAKAAGLDCFTVGATR